MPSYKDQVVALLHSLESGDPAPVASINPQKYIQHNLAVADGLEGFGAVLQNAPPGGFKAKVVRAFEDGDFVFTHTEYDFFGPKVGFDIFRFENGLIVEHWDNLADIQPPNPSGRTQLDGPTEAEDLDRTEGNKALVRSFVDTVLVGGDASDLAAFINPQKYHQHNPAIADGLEGLGAALQAFAEQGLVLEYDRVHHVLGEGNFVLTVSEGRFGIGDHSAFYDLFRVEDGKIVEHWDTIETIPERSAWRNDNGKF
ncbi:MAG: nuclear transport factor 2 family protein [Acidobacteriota bacterium]